MKKIVAVMAVVISTGAFAYGHNGQGNHSEGNKGKDCRGNGHMTQQLESLTPEQQAEFEVLHKEHMDSMKLSSLNMREIDLQIQKEMLAENPNQSSIEKLIDKKAGLQADKQKEALSFKLDMKEKFDLDMNMNKGHRKGMMSKSNQKNNRSRG